LKKSNFKKILSHSISQLDPNSIVKIKLIGASRQESLAGLSAAYLRQIAPATMNIELSIPEYRRNRAYSGKNKPNKKTPISRMQ